MSQKINPPFRADQVGSLLRTPAIKEARAKRALGGIDAAALTAIEDAEIRRLIAGQENAGLQSIPTVSSAAPGGIMIFSAALMASPLSRRTRASSLPACRPGRRHHA